jgi:phenylacetate-CoA ligase
MERASRDAITAHQTRRLAWSLRHAHDNVPQYRQAFAAAGAHPDDFRTAGDLARFPFTTDADLRPRDPFGLFAVPRDKLARLQTDFGATAGDLDTWAHLMARSIRAAGGRPGMRVLVAFDGPGEQYGAQSGAERLGCAVIPVAGPPIEHHVRLITDFEPELIMAAPAYLLGLADAFRAAGRNPRATTLKAATLGAEPCTEATRADLEQAFAMHALAGYGLPEVMGPGIAQECVESKDGPHIWEDCFYPEIIDPATGAVLSDGEPGELVLTTLANEAMPIIRYRTGELTRLLPGTARAMRRMEPVTGRRSCQAS